MIWGVVSALLANLLFSTGFVVEKRALAKLPPLSAARPAQLVLALLRSPLWIVGAGSLLLGFAAQLAVYRTLPLVAAQGLFVTGLVMLLLLSSLFLGERPTGRERQSMVTVIIALVMIVFSLRGGEEQISRMAPVPIMLLICVPSLALGLSIFLSAERRAKRRHRLPTAGVPYGVAVGFLYGVSSLAIKGVAGLLDLTDLTGTLAGILSSPYPYLLMVTGSTGLVLSQTALQRCRASLIVPVCTTVTFLYTVISGTIAFSEPLPEDPLRFGLRLGGALLAVSVLLALPRHDEPNGPADAGTGTDAGGRTDASARTDTGTRPSAPQTIESGEGAAPGEDAGAPDTDQHAGRVAEPPLAGPPISAAVRTSPAERAEPPVHRPPHAPPLPRRHQAAATRPNIRRTESVPDPTPLRKGP